MSMKVDEFFVLRKGATQEEQWSRDEIVERCLSGEFDAETRIFIADEGRWEFVFDADLGIDLSGEESPAADDEDPAAREAREAMEAEYSDLVERLDGAGTAVEPWLEAGCLAADLGRDDDARAHFQHGLELQPFHPRIAQEVRRRYPQSEWRRFHLLSRPEPAWESLGDVVSFPFVRGPLYAAIPAILFAALLFVPGGAFVVAQIAVLWGLRCLRAVAEGRSEPVAYARAVDDPVRNIVIPGGVIALVCAQWLALFWGMARLGMLAEGKTDIGVLAYMAGSPILVVLMTLCALAYLPAVLVLIDPTPRGVLRVLNPARVVRAALAMRSEYAMTLVLFFAMAVGSGIVSALTGGIPVVGRLVWAAATVVIMLAGAFVLGRLRARVAHQFAR